MTDWNAERYHRVSQPQFQWGQKVLSELQLRGDETVIDAGCGSGRLTALLLERLPQGRVIALDASEAMLDVARRELARYGDRVSFVHADLGALELDVQADVLFSTATFHWVLDHDALMAGLKRVIKPGGKLHAQCGGLGNLSAFMALARTVTDRPPFDQFLDGFQSPTFFATAEETNARLEAAGFHDVKTWLTAAPTQFADGADFNAFISTVVLRNALSFLPEALREKFSATVTEAAKPGYSLDYVRLEIRATASR